MVVLYNPVIPLDLPEWYLTREDFNLDNPVYTDQKICKEFESEIWKYKDFAWINKKDKSGSGIIFAKEAMLAQSNTAIIFNSAARSSTKYNSYKELIKKKYNRSRS